MCAASAGCYAVDVMRRAALTRKSLFLVAAVIGLEILGACSQHPAGLTAIDPPLPPLPSSAKQMAYMQRIPIDHTGAYSWTSQPLPGASKEQVVSAGLGHEIKNGTAEVTAFRINLSDSSRGLIMRATFWVSSFKRSPYLLLTRGSVSIGRKV